MRVPDNSDVFIFWLFNHRCIGIDDVCYKWAKEISHIVPRSSGNGTENWKNLVLHCRDCHDKYHARGASDEAIKTLQERRTEQLIMLGKEEYI